MPRQQRCHKRQGSDCDVQAPWIDTANLTSTDQPIVSPIAATVSSVCSTRTGKANEQQRTTVSRENSQSPSNIGLVSVLGTDDGTLSLKEAILGFRGTKVKVKFTRTHITWKPINPVGGCCVDRRSLARAAAFDEILSAVLPKSDCCPRLGCTVREYSFVIYTFSRKGPRCPNTWRLEEYVLSTTTPEVAKDWVNAINQRVRDIRDRPRNLLVFINPYAGTRLARLTWERHALPVFQRAGIAVNAVETTKQDHARDMLELMKSEDLAGYQGVVAVGGDGLFQEVVSGLLARRARGDTAAFKIRVGHVPAGSTDAVAYTLHGSRCATTAALHIALGDRLSLDSGRVDAADGSTRHFVCQAGYGFMGDVMRFSERLRFMGPTRYDVTGAVQYMRLASYRVKLSYREAPSTTADVQQLCTTQCEVCRMAGIRIQTPHPHRGGGGASPHAAGPTGGAGGAIGKVGGVSPRAAGTVPAGAINNNSAVTLFRSSPTPPASAPASFIVPADSAPSSGSLGPLPSGGASGVTVPGIPVWEAYGGHDGDGGGGTAGTGTGASGTLFRTSNTPPPGPAPASTVPALASGVALASTGLLAGERQSLGQAQQSAPQSSDVADIAIGAMACTPDSTSKHIAMGSVFATAAATATAAAVGGPHASEEGWIKAEGEYVSVMCIVTPCRSDKSKRGIIPNGHLSDGRMYLVLVSKCSHFDFLRFLLRLSTRGLVDRCLPFVRVIPITALKLAPLPGGHQLGGCLSDPEASESAWNVDGELLIHNDVDISISRGALEVFARGLETAAGN
ncbi:hypothetical protein VaNZ11_015451 [Volvox africanus]|uniref:DAGKc domain-containing protein n=1 Tax=Volvox africanus TaxID=51714 RepID=A0ABQ5SN29_9CHLO|nr:hypothetical protein VaNZ11_015451 [Volvox africanus]